MGFIQIVVMVCLIAQPDQSEEQHLQLAWQGSLALRAQSASPIRPMDRRPSAAVREAISLRISGHPAQGLKAGRLGTYEFRLASMGRLTNGRFRLADVTRAK
jgi:hypothetical protein